MAKVKKTEMLRNDIEVDFFDDGTMVISSSETEQDVVVNFIELMKVMKIRETEMVEELNDRMNNLVAHINDMQNDYNLV